MCTGPETLRNRPGEAREHPLWTAGKEARARTRSPIAVRVSCGTLAAQVGKLFVLKPSRPTWYQNASGPDPSWSLQFGPTHPAALLSLTATPRSESQVLERETRSSFDDREIGEPNSH